MKKIKALTFLIIFMLMGTVKPAQALMIDATQIATKISETLQKITDAANKISQQAAQIKLMMSQGFNFSGLIDINGFLSGLQGSLLNVDIDKQIKKVVEGTHQKNLDLVTAQQDAYGEASQTQYAAKLGYMQDNIDQTKEMKKKYENEATKKCDEKDQAKIDYDNETDPTQRSIKLEIYTNLVAECEDYTTRAKEANALLSELEEEHIQLKAEKRRFDAHNDAEYIALEIRRKALENQPDKTDAEFVGVESENIEWDSENFTEGFQLKDSDYTQFFKRYFYQSANSRVEAQSTIDRIMRERRYLLVNSAAHLLQVSATIRREIPVRTASIEKIFKNTPSSPGELGAKLSYAATRVENARTLLLYAKLLSAKIQYLAARDLVGIEPKKAWGDGGYSEFNLERYILTEEYVQNLVEEYNKTLEFNEELYEKYKKDMESDKK